MLNVSDRERFNQTGWLCIPKFFRRNTINVFRSSIDNLGREALSCLRSRQTSSVYPKLIVVPELNNVHEVCRYEYILASHQGLRENALPIITAMLKELCSENFVPFKDKVNNKPPGGGGYRPHQDIVAYKAFPPKYHVTVMLTIDDATKANGCLHVADNYLIDNLDATDRVAEWIGSKPVFHSNFGGPLNGDIRSDIVRTIRWRPLETKPEDLIVIDSFVPHYSESNSSPFSRRAVFLTFSLEKHGDWYEQYYDEKRRNPLDAKFHVSTPTRHDTTGGVF